MAKEMVEIKVGMRILVDTAGGDRKKCQRDMKDVCWLSYNSHNVKFAHKYAQDHHGKLGSTTI